MTKDLPLQANKAEGSYKWDKEKATQMESDLMGKRPNKSHI